MSETGRGSGNLPPPRHATPPCAAPLPPSRERPRETRRERGEESWLPTRLSPLLSLPSCQLSLSVAGSLRALHIAPLVWTRVGSPSTPVGKQTARSLAAGAERSHCKEVPLCQHAGENENIGGAGSNMVGDSFEITTSAPDRGAASVLCESSVLSFEAPRPATLRRAAGALRIQQAWNAWDSLFRWSAVCSPPTNDPPPPPPLNPSPGLL